MTSDSRELLTARSGWQTRRVPLGAGRWRPAGSPPGIVGIVNVTPDSFSDGGRLETLDDCIRAAETLVAEGACMLDVGGESTRAGAREVPAGEERRRVVPVVDAFARRFRVPISVDTTKAEVFADAHAHGASVLNDVSALSADPSMAEVVARTDAAVILMHRRGTPDNMMELIRYGRSVAADVAAELFLAVERAREAGVCDERLVLDPGLGFAKTADHNWELLRNLEPVRLDRYPLMVGPSRKSFLGTATGRERAQDRDVATAVVVAALARQGVELIRVHDAGAARDAIAVVTRLMDSDARAPA